MYHGNAEKNGENDTIDFENLEVRVLGQVSQKERL